MGPGGNERYFPGKRLASYKNPIIPRLGGFFPVRGFKGMDLCN